MSELALIEETAAGLIGGPVHEADWDPGAWAALEEAGLALVGVPEAHGGSGGTLREAAVVVRAAARAAAMLPIGETALLGGWLLASAGHDVPAGPITACVLESGSLVAGPDGLVLSGSARRVPWAGVATAVAVLIDGAVVRVDPALASRQPGANLAGEPRDDLHFDGVLVDAADARPVDFDPHSLALRGALLRAIGIAGAAEAAAALAFELVGRREQFGRTLGSFQAVQQMVAELAGEVAATCAAVDAATELETPFRVAAAKVQAGRGATAIARLAHQLHGAIGMTYESPLHLFTRRLWAWRDEYGSEAVWADELGRVVVSGGADGLWALLADGGRA